MPDLIELTEWTHPEKEVKASEDPRVTALFDIIKLLTSLPDVERHRVIDSTCAYFGISLVSK